jgi:ABC-type Na+ efflux pump permease subunit
VRFDALQLARLVFGHLTGIECRRGLGRTWLFWLRASVGTLLACALFLFAWSWWLSATYETASAPVDAMHYFLAATTLALLTIVVVQAPAVLAGSLAGERERGILHLLLTTAVTPREIVEGRLCGKLSQVGMVLLGGVPALAFLAPIAGLSFGQFLAILLLLSGVGLGAGGLAVGASVVSRRGRDAQLTVYILMFLFMLSPLLGWLGLPLRVVEALEWLNPYYSMTRLVWWGETARALATAGCWTVLGLCGTVIAVWRLRPTCLSLGVTRAKRARRIKAPPLGERPMLWKEMYIERVASLGRFGRWLGIVLTLLIGGGSLVLAGMMAYSAFFTPESDLVAIATSELGRLLRGFVGILLGWLLQWGIGLRAAVSIASERERGTWDALLLSPLKPAEISVAKLIGSLYALRYLAIAMLMAWTLAAGVHAITVPEYVTWIVSNLVMGSFMAAVGVRCSLSLPTATRAMSWTIGLWLAVWPVLACVALAIIMFVMLACTSIYMFLVSYHFISTSARPWYPMSFETGWVLTTNLTAFLITIFIVVDTSLRFDRIAGRMAGGVLATTVDAMVHGTAHKPVFLPDERPAKKAKARVAPDLPLVEELAAPTA